MTDSTQQQVPIDEEVRRKFETICTLGRKIEATSPKIDVKQKPDYFDNDRFKRAQKMINERYYTSIAMSSTIGLIILLQIRSILVPLLKSGKSQSVVHLWQRYTDTAKYIRACYETDFFDESTEGWRYLMIVRGMHQRIHKFMNEKFRELLTKEQMEAKEVWVNQFDMAITQFSFVGLFILYPDMCGAYNMSESDMLDIVYYWRVLSYYLGIEEDFNLFTYDEDSSRQKQLMQLVLDRVFREELKADKRPQVGVKMAEGVMLAFEDLLDYANFNILDHWWSPVISISGRQPPSPYTKYERYMLIRFLFVYKVLFKSQTLVRQMNRLYKKKFDKFLAKGEKVKKNLTKKYGDLRYVEEPEITQNQSMSDS